MHPQLSAIPTSCWYIMLRTCKVWLVIHYKHMCTGIDPLGPRLPAAAQWTQEHAIDRSIKSITSTTHK